MTSNASQNPTQCQRCSRPHVTSLGLPSCAAHSKTRDGAPCGNDPMHGQKVCRIHGGSSARSRAAGAQRVAEAAAQEAVRTLGLPVDVSPTEALLEEVRWTAGHVQWLRARVQELNAEPTHTVESLAGEDLGMASRDGRGALTWGTTKVTTGDTAGTTQEAKPSLWYELYTRERTHLVRVCAEAIRAGVEERRVRLAEQQGELVAGAIRAILADLGLSAEQEARVSEVVPRHLRVLAGGAA